MEEMRCARNALAVSLDSSLDQRLVVRMRSRRHPVGVDVHHGLDGLPARWRFAAADQHAIGMLEILDGGAFGQELRVGDDVEVDALVPLALRMHSIASAVRTGSVLFSTTILDEVEFSRIWRAVFSQYCRSAALPAPWPKVLVAVLTLTKMMSASAMFRSTSVEKKRLRPRVTRTTSSKPGS